MAAKVAAHQDIIVKKSCFGLVKKAFYTPTDSSILALQNDYSAENGDRIKQIINAPEGQLEAAVKAFGGIDHAPMGPFRVEVCLSADHQFAAVQAFGYSDFEYKPLADVRFFTGNEADIIGRLLAPAL